MIKVKSLVASWRSAGNSRVGDHPNLPKLGDGLLRCPFRGATLLRERRRRKGSVARFPRCGNEPASCRRRAISATGPARRRGAPFVRNSEVVTSRGDPRSSSRAATWLALSAGIDGGPVSGYTVTAAKQDDVPQNESAAPHRAAFALCGFGFGGGLGLDGAGGFLRGAFPALRVFPTTATASIDLALPVNDFVVAPNFSIRRDKAPSRKAAIPLHPPQRHRTDRHDCKTCFSLSMRRSRDLSAPSCCSACCRCGAVSVWELVIVPSGIKASAPIQR